MHSRIQNLIIIFLLALLICSGITIFFLHKENKKLQSGLKELEKDAMETIKKLNGTINKLEKENKKLYKDLQRVNRSYQMLREEYRELNKSYNELGEAYTSQQSDLNKAISSINLYEEELQNSMEWFETNSELETLQDEKIEQELEDKCMKGSNIKLGCLYLVNKQLGYEYKKDQEIGNRTDKLQSLTEFRENKGGDCEDYGLFYKAELNYLLEQTGETKLETYKPGEDKQYLDYNEQWYVENVEKITFEGDFKPVVVCGRMYDLNTETQNGHCVIALAENKIEDTGDLSVLRGVPMIEPQDGSFYGTIGEDVALGRGDSKSFITVIITNNDLFLHSSGGEWMSYALFEERLKNLEGDIS